MHSGVDWKKAPKDAIYWAVDADGSAHWFNSPNVVPFTQFWHAEETVAPLFGFYGDWRKSLTLRPRSSPHPLQLQSRFSR
jgi:hypothetical protein